METNVKLIIQADGRDYQVMPEALTSFLEDINKFASASEFQVMFEVLAEYAEDGVPDNYPIAEYKRIMRLLRKTSILLQDMIQEVE